jgi:hypothetical protein
MTRAALNNILWTLSLILQAGLLTRLFRTKLALRVPSFTLLLGFYVVRSLSLYLLSSHMAQAGYGHLLALLGLVDLFLQLAVAIELEMRLFPLGDLANVGQTLRGVAILVAIPAFALAATVLLTASLPNRTPAATDMLQLYDSLFFLLLGFLTTARIASRYLLRLALGFAGYGMVCIASTIARSFAFIHKNAQSYITWSYVASIAWLVTVAVWMVVLTRGISSESVETAR